MTGAEAALPIWIDVMKAWIGDRKEPPKFEPPGNIVFVSVDKRRRLDRRPSPPGRFPRPSSRGPSRAACAASGSRPRRESGPVSSFFVRRRLPQRS